jgi:sigma-B regulation protein RsbU (phosphoserine phosphatase)
LTKRLILANKNLLKKQELLDEDLRAAAGIQRSLLPSSLLNIDIVNVAWSFMPCQRIGGDIFNVIRLDKDHLAIYMLDVSGHGVPSALVAVSVSQMLHPSTGFLLEKSTSQTSSHKIMSPSEVLNTLDREFPIERFDKFFTISYHVLNTKGGSLRYSNAAHPPPVLLHPDGTLELLEEGGTIIGMGGVIPFDEGEKQLRFGDKLFIYTDGIVEYQNEKGLFYGRNRFYKELQRLKDKSISDMIDGIIGSVMDFGEHIEPADDISLLGLEFMGERGKDAT